MSFILKLNAQELTFQNELYKLKLEIKAIMSRLSRIRTKGGQLFLPSGPVADVLNQMYDVFERFYSLETPPISEDNLKLFEDTLFTYDTMVYPFHIAYLQILSHEDDQMANERTEDSEVMISPTTSYSTTTITTRSSANATTTIPNAKSKSQEFLDKLRYQISYQRQKIAQKNHTDYPRRPERKRGSTSPRQLSISTSTSSSPTSSKTPHTVPMPCDAEHRYGCPPGIGLYEMYMRGTNKHTTNQD